MGAYRKHRQCAKMTTKAQTLCSVAAHTRSSSLSRLLSQDPHPGVRIGRSGVEVGGAGTQTAERKKRWLARLDARDAKDREMREWAKGRRRIGWGAEGEVGGSCE